jgi:ribosomal protein L29
MKKSVKEFQGKSTKELEKEVVVLRTEIAKLKLQEKVNPSKDTNKIHKKKKLLAVLLTVKTQKKEAEKLSNIKK